MKCDSLKKVQDLEKNQWFQLLHFITSVWLTFITVFTISESSTENKGLCHKQVKRQAMCHYKLFTIFFLITKCYFVQND